RHRHDGQPCTAADLELGWQVSRRPALGSASDVPQSLMERVEIPDPLTFVVHWSQPYPDADLMEGFIPLPQHILESSFQDLRPDVWENLPFWTRDYLALGAFRVDGWDPGASLDAVAFDGYVLGRPRSDR